MKENKLSIKNKLAFASADIFGGGSFNIINFLYPGFLALTVGLSPYWIGFIMFIARVWDAVSDPLMGIISDRTTNAKFGKRRVYLVISAPLILLAMFLMFFPYSFESVGLRVVAVLLSYLLFCTVQTMMMIPYYSLSSELSSDYGQRASANSFRLGFSIFSSILCVAVPGIIVDMVGNDNGYIVMSLIFGLLFGLSVLITGLFSREEIVTPALKRKFNFKEFLVFLKVKPFLQYLGMLLCVQLTMAIMSAMYFFYIDFCFARDITAAGGTSPYGLIGAALMFSTQIVALPLYLKLINKKSKAYVYKFGSVIWIVSAAVLFLVPPGAPGYLIILGSFAIGAGISGPGLIPHAIFGDVADACQLINGKRNEGTMSGFVNFLNKVAQAIGLAAVMAILGAFGFVSKEAGADAILSQCESAQLAIKSVLCFAPAVVMSLGILIANTYTITAEKQHEIQTAIQSNDEDKIKELRKEYICE